MRTPRPHPLSADFRWEDRRGPFRRVTEAEREAFDRLGFVKFEGAFTADEIAAVTAAIDPLEVAAEERLRRAGVGPDQGRMAVHTTFMTAAPGMQICRVGSASQGRAWPVRPPTRGVNR